jgi:type VI protein secretion system component Hcp
MAFDAFMQLIKGGKPAVQGETLDAKFGKLKAFELTKFKLTSQRDMTSEEGEAEGDEPVFILNIEKEIDSATPDLFLNYCRYATTKNSGTFDEAIVTVRKAAGAAQLEYLVYRFRDVYIKSWRLENTDEDGLPEEVVDFCFHHCSVEYYAQKPGGAGADLTEGSWDFWDLSQNKVD